MKRLQTFGLVSLVAMAVSAFVAIGPATGQIKQGKERPLKTEHLMEAVVSPQCGALKKGLEAGPSDNKAWKEVTINAELLNECGHILMADGRCPDKVWADACATLRDSSEAVLGKINSKDSAGALEAFGKLTQACASCHKAHRAKK